MHIELQKFHCKIGSELDYNKLIRYWAHLHKLVVIIEWIKVDGDHMWRGFLIIGVQVDTCQIQLQIIY